MNDNRGDRIRLRNVDRGLNPQGYWRDVRLFAEYMTYTPMTHRERACNVRGIADDYGVDPCVVWDDLANENAGDPMESEV